MLMRNQPKKPLSIEEKQKRISRGVAVWNKTEEKWGVYQKSDVKAQDYVLLWLGSDKDTARYCQYNNVKLPKELRALSAKLEAEDEAAHKVRMKARAEAEAEAKVLEAERREKYLESLSAEDREDVLKRERERERKREDVLEGEREKERISREVTKLQEKREYERMPEPGKKRARKLAQKSKGQPQSILDLFNKEPEEPEEVVFPWEEPLS